MLENLPFDKIYKFLTVLGILILVTTYKMKENKLEQVQTSYDTIYDRNISLINIVERSNLLVEAKSQNEKRLDDRDSITFSKMAKSQDTSELSDFARYTKKIINGIYASMDSSAIANANLKAIVNAKQREISSLQVILERRKDALEKWSAISFWLNILGAIFFIVGISSWFLNDKTETSPSAKKVRKLSSK